MMTSTEQEAFFRFKMKVLPLAIKVFIARGDYDTVRPMQPLKPGEMVFDEAGKLHEVVAAPVLDTQCEGFEVEPGVMSGCSGTGGDCPACGK